MINEAAIYDYLKANSPEAVWFPDPPEYAEVCDTPATNSIGKCIMRVWDDESPWMIPGMPPMIKTGNGIRILSTSEQNDIYRSFIFASIQFAEFTLGFVIASAMDKTTEDEIYDEDEDEYVTTFEDVPKEDFHNEVSIAKVRLCNDILALLRRMEALGETKYMFAYSNTYCWKARGPRTPRTVVAVKTPEFFI